ncbi:MAG: hypothetical protein J5647_05670 [Spirochaetaceae bacterium]|nr:hypothetical protein [Spirochaetaceae bacterium]
MSRYFTSKGEPGELITQYLNARDEAVKSMDVNKFKDFIKNHSMRENIPSDEVLEITMRKMAVHITSLDIDTRVDAFRWLLERGYDFYLD